MAASSSSTPNVSDSEDSDGISIQKPNLPYRRGFEIIGWRHEPPQPHGIGYSTKLRPQQEGWKKLSQVDYCLSRPPLEGQTDYSCRKSLTITSTIRTGRDRGAQLVVVNRTMVAKIYDPLYYNPVNDCGYKEDVVRYADGDYCREAAAYEHLQKSSDARLVTPAYYGTWTMDVETPVKLSRRKMRKSTRPVRFILMERMYGDSMEDLDPDEFSENIRSMILREVIVAESFIYDAGVDHRDLCLQNIFILDSNYDDPDVPVNEKNVQVKIFDFNIAQVMTHPRALRSKYLAPLALREPGWPSKLLSPILRHNGQMMEFSTTGWCSNDDGEAEKWLWHHFHNDHRYIPVIWNPDQPEMSPEYQEPLQHRQDSVDEHGSSSILAELEEHIDNVPDSDCFEPVTVELAGASAAASARASVEASAKELD